LDSGFRADMWSRKSLKWVDLGRLNYDTTNKEDLRGERSHFC
jgi:hypothetical protein